MISFLAVELVCLPNGDENRFGRFSPAKLSNFLEIVLTVVLFSSGVGLSENIRESYAFLATNYTPADALSQPDSIFLLGFSRGAFTARSLGGFIAAVGILSSKAMPFFFECFSDWENAGNDDYTPTFIDVYCHNNPEEEAEVRKSQPPLKMARTKKERGIDKYMSAYQQHLLSLGLTQEVKIKVIGVFDTVGALGIPINPVLQHIGLPSFIREYRWYDTRLSNVVENAFQALALDETRSPYAPALWELDKDDNTNLKQVWFPGAHSNVGGTYPDYGMANITLAWMMDQVSGNSRDPSKDFDPLDWIQFDPKALDVSSKHTRRWYETQDDGGVYNGWGLGKVYQSNTFPQSLIGSAVRTPGLYRETDYVTGKYIDEYLTKTNEYIHACVRTRMDLGGREIEPKNAFQALLRRIWRSISFQPMHNLYRPQRPRKGIVAAGPLKDWKLVDGHSSHQTADLQGDLNQEGSRQVHWEYVGSAKPVTKTLKEDVFVVNGFEEQILRHDQGKAHEMVSSTSKWQVCGR